MLQHAVASLFGKGSVECGAKRPSPDLAVANERQPASILADKVEFGDSEVEERAQARQKTDLAPQPLGGGLVSGEAEEIVTVHGKGDVMLAFSGSAYDLDLDSPARGLDLPPGRLRLKPTIIEASLP